MAGNMCVRLPGSCDQFVCQCSAPGYYSTPGSRKCLPSPSQSCVNPCNQGDPCSAVDNPLNRCTQPPGTCGVYACVCSQPGWVTPWGARSCKGKFLHTIYVPSKLVVGRDTSCENPCAGTDRCSSADRPGNVCVQLPQACNQYTCSCSEPGWSSANSGLSCVRTS